MIEPKCPSCDVSGTKHIISAPSNEESNGGDPWFNIAYCSECGHVYGVFAKVVRSPSAPVFSRDIPGT